MSKPKSLHTDVFTRKMLPSLGMLVAVLAATYAYSPALFDEQVHGLIANGPTLILAFAVGGYISNKFLLHDVEDRMIRAFKTIMADKGFQREMKEQFDAYFGEYWKQVRKELEDYIIKFAKVIKREVIGDDDGEIPSPLTKSA